MNAIAMTPEKEVVGHFTTTAIDIVTGSIKDPVTVKIYRARNIHAKQYYASVWFTESTYGYTTGKGKGGDICNAVEAAIKDSGITLSKPIEDYQDIYNACDAVVNALGFKRYKTIGSVYAS